MDNIDYQALLVKAAHFNRLYRSGAPVISDQEYDRLVNQIAEYERTLKGSPDPRSPTQNVDTSTGKGTMEFKHPMLSLDNIYERDRLLEWAKRTGVTHFVLEPKVDGVAVRVFTEGMTNKYYTRGDGRSGNQMSLNRVPYLGTDSFRFTGNSVLDGELFVPDAKAINLGYPNGRAAAVAASTSKSPSPALLDALRIFPYLLIEDNGKSKLFGDWFRAPVTLESFEDSLKLAIDRITEACKEENVPIDGYVLKVNDLVARERLGVNRRAYRWAIAYKPNDISGETTVKNVTASLSRFGTLTPVLNVEPLTLNGTVIKNVNIHNPSYFTTYNFKVGDRVVIRHAGKVIPDVVENLGGGLTPINGPGLCPSCKGTVVAHGGRWRCVNAQSCDGVALKRLEYAFGIEALNIDGLGPKRIKVLYDKGLVKLPGDLWDITTEDLKAHDLDTEWWHGLVSRLKTHSHKFPLWRGLMACAKEGNGPVECQSVAKKSVDIYDAVGNGDAFDVDWAISLGRRLEFDTSRRPVGVLTGRTVAITGSHPSLSRRDLVQLLTSGGADVTRSVGRKTDYLFFGEDSGGRLKIAKELGVTLVDIRDIESIVVGRKELPSSSRSSAISYKGLDVYNVYWHSDTVYENLVPDPVFLELSLLHDTDNNDSGIRKNIYTYSGLVALRTEEDLKAVLEKLPGKILTYVPDRIELQSLDDLEAFIEDEVNHWVEERIKSYIAANEVRRESLNRRSDISRKSR